MRASKSSRLALLFLQFWAHSFRLSWFPYYTRRLFFLSKVGVKCCVVWHPSTKHVFFDGQPDDECPIPRQLKQRLFCTANLSSFRSKLGIAITLSDAFHYSTNIVLAWRELYQSSSTFSDRLGETRMTIPRFVEDLSLLYHCCFVDLEVTFLC